MGAFEDRQAKLFKGGDAWKVSKTCEVENVTQIFLDCYELWSREQLNAMVMLTTSQSAGQGLTKRFEKDVIERSKKTAGNYAELFMRDNGTDNEHRFYWAGLAAFAAKEVVSGALHAKRWSKVSVRPKVLSAAATSLYYLLKGNTWLFLDVMPWMLYYRRLGYSKFVDCQEERHSDTYIDCVRDKIEKLPWAHGKNKGIDQELPWWGARPDTSTDTVGALAEVDHFTCTEEVSEWAEKVIEGGASKNPQHEDAKRNEKSSPHFDSAFQLAKHEQENRLQKLIYEHDEFVDALEFNETALGWHLPGSRPVELLFNSALSFDEMPMDRDWYFKNLSYPTYSDRSGQAAQRHAHSAIEEQLAQDSQALDPESDPLTRDDITATMDPDEDGHLYNRKHRMKYVEGMLEDYDELMMKHKNYMHREIGIIASQWRNEDYWKNEK